MKKQLLILGIAAGLLCSCAEDPEVRSIKGGYHYKTSGQVTIAEADTLSQRHILENESGVLEVVSLYNADSLLITLNQTNGGVYHFKGTTDGSHLTLDSYQRTLKVNVEKTVKDTILLETTIGIPLIDTIITRTVTEPEIFDITVSGRGDVYENNLILNMTYEGTSQSSGRTLYGTDIQMLAKKN